MDLACAGETHSSLVGLVRRNLPLIPPDVHVGPGVAQGARAPDHRPAVCPDPSETDYGICSQLANHDLETGEFKDMLEVRSCIELTRSVPGRITSVCRGGFHSGGLPRKGPTVRIRKVKTRTDPGLQIGHCVQSHSLDDPVARAKRTHRIGNAAPHDPEALKEKHCRCQPSQY